MKISTHLMQKIVLTLITISLGQFVYSQENYVAGYVVRKNGDTLHGLIRRFGAYPNSYKVSFKSAQNGDRLHYTPSEIKAYGIGKETFVCAVVETETSPDQTDGLDNDGHLNFQTDTAFLQAVVEGPKSLYYMTTKLGKSQYYIKTDSGFELLVHKTYSEINDGKPVITENRKYLGQLIYYFQDCPKVASQLNGKSYHLEDIRSLFDYYYAHTNQKVRFQKRREKIAAQFSLIAGLSTTSLSFSGSSADYVYMVGAHYTRSTDFNGGVSFRLILPGFKKALSINNELAWTNYKIEGRYLGFQYENIVIDATLAYSYFKMNNLICYQFPAGKIKLFIDAGLSNGLAINETNERTTTHTLPTNTIVTHLPAIYNTRKYESGLLFGGGVKFKKCSFELRYEIGNGMKNTASFGSTSHRITGLIGFTF